MIEFDPNTIGTLVVPLIRLGVDFSDKFLKQKRNSEKNLNTEPNSIDNNRKAAWELYVEMNTRIITQPLHPKHGDEKTALKSVYSLFKTTRDILKEAGPGCVELSEVAFAVLNQKVRPFTTKWHRKKLKGAFKSKAKCAKFRKELVVLQEVLSAYSVVLAKMAGIEDPTNQSKGNIECKREIVC